MITRKRCALCQHEDREEMEAALEGGFISCDDLDKREGWRSGTAAQHMRNHMGDIQIVVIQNVNYAPTQ